jgi:hypothetical protein
MIDNPLFAANVAAARSMIIAAARKTHPERTPSRASVRRVAEYIADTPGELLRPGITAESVAAAIRLDTGREPSRLRKEDFDCAFADAATV